MKTLLVALLLVALCDPAHAEKTVLNPVQTESPRSTLKTFLSAMNDYKLGLETKNQQLVQFIDRAIRTLNLENTPIVVRKEVGRESAILIKEVIDRITVVKFDTIPGESAGNKSLPARWRLQGTDIVISLVESGDRAGEYLFSQDTVYRAHEFYEAVKHLPYLKGSGRGALYSPPLLYRYLPEWSQEQTLGLVWWQWVAILVALFIGLLLKAISRVVIAIAKRIGKLVPGAWLDKVLVASEKPIGLLVACIFWLLTLHSLQISGTTFVILSVTIKILFGLAIVWLFYRLSGVFSEYLTLLAKKSDFDLDDQLVVLLSRAIRLFVVVFGILIAVQNLGVNVASLLAGLGLGGLAFALAARDTAANLFGTMMILSDKPFRVGDWIKTNDGEGTVEEIGFRSTRIRTFYNSLISVPNSSIAGQYIDNMGQRKYRRVKTTLSLTYDTPPEKMEAFLEGLKNIILANPYTRKDFFHVVFSDYGASSLDILVYFFLEVPGWPQELVEKQNVYLEILRLAKKVGVDFAFPTQSLHVETFPEKQLIRKPHSVDRSQLQQAAKQFGPEGSDSKPSGSGIFTPPYKSQ